MKASKLILLSLVATSLLGCKQENVLPDSALVCEEPRPEMCTMDYRPACGTQSSDQKKTYSNACTACSDPNVQWVIEGECTD